jgi:signal transduction histidine kinase
MKYRNLIPVIGLVFLLIFAFLIVRFTNHNIGRTFQDSCSSTFYLLSSIVNRYLKDEAEIAAMRIAKVKSQVSNIMQDPIEPNSSSIPHDIEGWWIWRGDSLYAMYDHSTIEVGIVDFYARNLRAKDTHSLIMINGQPYLLINFLTNDVEVLLLAEAKGISGTRIHMVLDSIVTTSNLTYFAVLEKDETPVLFSTLYENFLPLRGSGYHTIETPRGNIFQIEGQAYDRTVVAGFAMLPLEKITSANNTFLISVIILFAILEGILVLNYIKFTKFKTRQEREIKRLKEIGALSTGFAHEFRNSLNALSLVYDDLQDKEKRILIEETDRMKSIMDSLSAIGITDITKESVSIREIVDEAISLLGNVVENNSVKIRKNIPATLKTRGNRLLLVTSFSNIVKNSIEANAKTVSISAAKKGKNIHIDCEDDGNGIEREMFDRIFEPFFSKKGQSGIGLYLVKRITELHGGKIEIRHNKKTQFRITLSAQ